MATSWVQASDLTVRGVAIERLPGDMAVGVTTGVAVGVTVAH
jgi:hypothetical protein